jgi:hypothetical protein
MARKLAQAPLELISGDRAVPEAGHDETDACPRPGRTCERGRRRPNLEMRGSNALPLSPDAL